MAKPIPIAVAIVACMVVPAAAGPRRGGQLAWCDKSTGRLLFSAADIVRFDWDRQVFKLTPQRAMDLMTWKAPHVPGSRTFVVRVAAGLIYEGRFISPVSSIPYDGPTIVDPNPRVAPPLYAIQGGYPTGGGQRDRRRFAPRLRSALQAAGVLGKIAPGYKPRAIQRSATGWVGRKDQLRVRAEIFPRTFRIGQSARAHLMLAWPPGRPPSASRIRIHSTLTTDGGAFFCTTDHGNPEAGAPGAGVAALRWRPWGPVFGARQSTPKPGPAEITFRVTLRDAKGKVVCTRNLPRQKLTLGPPAVSVRDLDAFRAAARKRLAEVPAGNPIPAAELVKPGALGDDWKLNSPGKKVAKVRRLIFVARGETLKTSGTKELVAQLTVFPSAADARAAALQHAVSGAAPMAFLLARARHYFGKPGFPGDFCFNPHHFVRGNVQVRYGSTIGKDAALRVSRQIDAALVALQPFRPRSRRAGTPGGSLRLRVTCPRGIAPNHLSLG